MRSSCLSRRPIIRRSKVGAHIADNPGLGVFVPLSGDIGDHFAPRRTGKTVGGRGVEKLGQQEGVSISHTS